MKLRAERLFLFLVFYLLALPVLAKRCGGQEPPPTKIVHHFAVPNPTARFSPFYPNISELPANEKYDQWWHEIADCEGLILPPFYTSVRFLQINAVHFYDQELPSLFWKDGEIWVRWAVGQSYILEGLIFVALPLVDEEWVIKHEQLHFLIAWNGINPGDDKHPMPYYQRCGMGVIYHGPK